MYSSKALLGLQNNRDPQGPLYYMGCHPEFANKTGVGSETTLVDWTRLVPGDHANYSSGPMAGRGPRNKLVA